MKILDTLGRWIAGRPPRNQHVDRMVSDAMAASRVLQAQGASDVVLAVGYGHSVLVNCDFDMRLLPMYGLTLAVHVQPSGRLLLAVERE